MDHFSGCLVCGSDIIYENENRAVTCFYCDTREHANVHCKNDHFVCDMCHASSANDFIEYTCNHTHSTDPFQLASTLFHHPAIKMHGPEHHFLVPAVLLTVFYNYKNQRQLKTKKLQIARQRASNIKGGSCGTCGTCGAAVGTGIFISLITEATPLSRGVWGLSNMMTAESLHRIAIHSGPRCCKRVTYLAIDSAVEFLKKHFEVYLTTIGDIKCEFNSENKECLELDCPFYTID